MRVRKKEKKFLAGLLSVTAFFCLALSVPVQAANVSFGQSILPVRFVYLDRQGEIKDIWSNISSRDGAYVVKFFDERTRREVSLNGKLLGEYQKRIVRNEKQNFLDREMLVKSDKKSQISIDFIKKDNSLEEVRTIV